MSDHHAQYAPLSVARLLQQHLVERGLSQRQLAAQSGVPVTTIHRWLKEMSTHPYHRGGLLKVAIALKLRRTGVNRLLNAAGYPSLDALASTDDPDELALLAHWTSAVRNNLPADLTSFVGRDEEIMEVAELVCRESVRLITLAGTGGSGKTRLARRVAEEVFDNFPDGVFWVPLGAVSDPRLVIQRIADAVDLHDVVDSALQTRLVNWLRTRRVLVLLDNVEQILGCGPDIVGLLHEARGLNILVTSRIPLHVSGEYVWLVDPFAVPPPDWSYRAARRNSAVELFRQRSEAANPRRVLDGTNLAAVLEICARLDGLPLAIELAAARTRDRDPEQLLVDFPNRLDLAGDGPRDVQRHQQTLRDTIAWSVQLLPENAQTLLFRLAVFSGGWTEEAADAVCDADGRLAGTTAASLKTLLDANLINRISSSSGTIRYQVLETIHEYGCERLAESRDESRIRDAHARYFLKLAESGPPYVPETRPDGWYERIDADLDNIRAALSWASAIDDLETEARFAAALWPYWHEYLRAAEGHEWLGTVLPRRDQLSPALRASILTGACLLTSVKSEFHIADELGREALDLWRQIDDHRGPAIVFQQLGWGRYMLNMSESSISFFAAALDEWRQVGDPYGIALARSDLAVTHCALGDLRAAMPYLVVAEASGPFLHDDRMLARSLRDRGIHALLSGDLVAAISLLEEAVDRLRMTGRSYLLAPAISYLATAYCFAGKLDEAVRNYVEAVELPNAVDDQPHLALTFLGFAAVASRQKDGRRAAILCGASQSVQQANGFVLPPAVQEVYTRETDQVRESIGNTVFAAAFENGAEMTIKEALAFARAGLAVT